MTDDPVRVAIFDAIRPPSENWEHTRTSCVFDQLLGAAAALLQSKQILLQYLSSGGSLDANWKIGPLYHEFEGALSHDGIIDFHHSAEVSVWSAGFFLDSGEAKVANALDRCVNAWVSIISRIPPWEVAADTSDELEFHPFISIRLAKIKREAVPDYDIDALCNAFMTTSLQARRNIKDWAKRETPTRLAAPQTLFTNLVLNSDQKHEACIALIFSQVNALKHSTLGAPHRSIAEILLESAIAVRALIYVGHFWKAMISHHKKPAPKMIGAGNRTRQKAQLHP